MFESVITPTIQVVARAPLRISFGGGGTDLPAYYEQYGGRVLSVAISRCCEVVGSPADDRRFHLDSADYNVKSTLTAAELNTPDAPLSLPRAALAWALERGWLQRGVHLHLAADVPPGTGLGSSSAMAVALVTALSRLAGANLAPAEVAEAACQIEIERLGMPIGKQDQYASAFGGLNRIQFSKEGTHVEPLHLPQALLDDLDAQLLLFATGTQRHSAAILGEQRRATAAGTPVVERLHRIKTLGDEMTVALTAGDLDRFGELLDVAWQTKRGLGAGVSSAAIDTAYAAARAAGALGGKITGAGGGGFLLLLCPVAQQAALRSAMTGLGLEALPFGFAMQGATVVAGSTLPPQESPI